MSSLAKSTVNCTNSIIISDVKIHMDSEGRYSLNDLHVASGKEEKHQPAFFMRRNETIELINEIFNSADMQNKNPVLSKKGRYGGTYVCKELVYSYAMWISAAFALKVIRAYDAMVTATQERKAIGGKTSVAERTPLRDAVNMLVGKKGLRYDDAYNMVHQRFGIDSIDELSIEQIPLAVEYIHRVVLEGEFIGKQEELPAPKLEINFPISWFAENAPYAIIRQQCGDTVALDRSALIECSPAYKLIDILTKAGYDVSAVRAELKALRHLMAEQSWALKEIASFSAIRDRACHSIKL
ncbi:KilA-N domain-containing protein [Salmonella enterica]|nr:KilA-N domain-containing protein [Salmonella enterica]EAY3203460.1 KilA-N domain-containing protein [Salmonella enterica]